MSLTEAIDSSYEHVKQSLLKHLPYMASFRDLHRRDRCEECKRWPDLGGLNRLCDKHICKRCRPPRQEQPIGDAPGKDNRPCPQCQVESVYPDVEYRPTGLSMPYDDFKLVEETLKETAAPPMCGSIRDEGGKKKISMPANVAGGGCGKELATHICITVDLFLCKICWRQHRRQAVLNQTDDDDDDYRYLELDQLYGKASLDNYEVTTPKDREWMQCCYYGRDHQKMATHYCQQCDKFLCNEHSLLHGSVDSSKGAHKIETIRIALDGFEKKLTRDREAFHQSKTAVDDKRAVNDMHLARMKEQMKHATRQVNDTYDELVKRLTRNRDALLQMLERDEKWITDELGQADERFADAHLSIAATETICEKMLDKTDAKRTKGLVHLHRFRLANEAKLSEFYNESVRDYTDQVLLFLRQKPDLVKNEHILEALKENKGNSNLIGKIDQKETTVDLNF